jgi:hypothetical protein
MTSPVELAQKNAQIAVRHCTLWTDFLNANDTQRKEAMDFCADAKLYLAEFSWGKDQNQVYVGMLHPGIIGVFLFEVIHNFRNVDDWVWVIVGDLPYCFITLDDAPTPGAALDGYIGAMYEWVHAAKQGRSVEGLVPVNVVANVENAELLQTRLDFLDKNILPLHPQDA